ncbi:MAG: WD40 repeat domain-containing protein, partial [Gemmatimonadota bacterium]
GSDGAVRVWDAASGRVLAHADPRAGEANAVAWSRDGRTLASGHDDGSVRLWDPDTLSRREVLEVPGGGVLSLAWSPDGSSLAAGTGEGPVVVLEGDHGARRVGGHDGHVYVLTWSPEGSHLASGGSDAVVRLWDRATGFAPRAVLQDRAMLDAATRTLPGGGGAGSLPLQQLAVVSLAWSPDGTKLVSGNRVGALRFWDPWVGSPDDLLFGDWDLGVWSLTWSADGKLLALGVGSGQVVLADPAERQQAALPTGHRDCVRGLAFGPDGRVLASCGDDGTVRLWEARSLWERAPSMGDPREGAHSDRVHRLTWSDDGRFLAARDAGARVICRDAETGGPLGALKGSQELPAAAIAPGRPGIILFGPRAGDERNVPVLRWDRGMDATTVLVRAPGPGFALALSPDGKVLASGDVAGTVWLTGVQAGDSRGVFLIEKALGFRPEGRLPVWGLAWSPDGRLIAAAGAMGLVIWNVPSGVEAQTVLRRPRLPGPMEDTGPSGEGGTVLWLEEHPVAWSPDGSVLASSSSESTIHLWRPITGEPIGALEGHEGVVSALDWSSDGRLLASASHDGTVRVWDVSGRRPVAVARCLSSVLAVRFDAGPNALQAADDGAATGLRPMPYRFELRGHPPRTLGGP